jgi:hypothetical protein
MCAPTIEKYGASPIGIQWTVVRGDTANLAVQFFEDDETTLWNTTGWTYKATAYDPTGDYLDDIFVSMSNGILTLTAPGSVTENWGSKYKSIVAQLPFDLQIIIPEDGEDITWTPLIGTICVMGDITPRGSL